MLLALINKYCSEEEMTHEEMQRLRYNIHLYNIKDDILINDIEIIQIKKEPTELFENGNITRR